MNNNICLCMEVKAKTYQIDYLSNTYQGKPRVSGALQLWDHSSPTKEGREKAREGRLANKLGSHANTGTAIKRKRTSHTRWQKLAFGHLLLYNSKGGGKVPWLERISITGEGADLLLLVSWLHISAGEYSKPEHYPVFCQV